MADFSTNPGKIPVYSGNSKLPQNFFVMVDILQSKVVIHLLGFFENVIKLLFLRRLISSLLTSLTLFIIPSTCTDELCNYLFSELKPQGLVKQHVGPGPFHYLPDKYKCHWL